MTADEYLAERLSWNGSHPHRSMSLQQIEVLSHEIRLAYLAGAAAGIQDCADRLKSETDASYRCPVHRADMRCHRTVNHEGECAFDLNEAL